MWEYSREEGKKKAVLTLKVLSVFPEDRNKYTNTNNELRLSLKKKKVANVKQSVRVVIYVKAWARDVV